jgi:hypothetical protein
VINSAIHDIDEKLNEETSRPSHEDLVNLKHLIEDFRDNHLEEAVDEAFVNSGNPDGLAQEHFKQLVDAISQRFRVSPPPKDIEDETFSNNDLDHDGKLTKEESAHAIRDLIELGLAKLESALAQ